MLLPSKISPSMMCADRFRIGETLRVFEENGINYLHLDIMDGLFVPNFALGTDECRWIRKNCAIPADYHFMVQTPEQKTDWFPILPGDIVSVHAESTCQLKQTLLHIREKGAKAFAALCPATPITALADSAEYLDGVLVMAVDPGFAGQKMIPGTLEKIKAVREWLDHSGRYDVQIEVDGNVSFVNAEKMREAGADLFVAGSSGIFCPGNLTENIARFRMSI